jgi:lantibiotic modifying enzyme
MNAFRARKSTLITRLQLLHRASHEASSTPNEDYFCKAPGKIFALLQRNTSTGPGHSIRWLEAVESPEGAAHAFTSPYLYNGTAGIALFLSAYYLISGCPEARDLAVRAIAPVRAKLNSWKNAGNQFPSTAIPIGGLNGVGAFVYTFLRMAKWLGIPEFLESAQLAAAAITPERIRADESFDVLSGCAGALLALLAFLSEPAFSREELGGITDSAIACGKHLLARRTASTGGPRAWACGERAPMTGFAHGASGIGYGLVKLFGHTGHKEFLDAALEAFRFERSLYNPCQKTWLDPRFERPLEQAAWCNGAPGIALSRLGAVRVTPLASLFDDLEIALRITAALPESPRDHLCCGNFGWIEIMSTAGRELNQPDLAELARGLAAKRLKRAETSNFCFPFTDQRPVEWRECSFQPSLFLGLAGAGYAMLRLLQPEVFPCLLLLD